MGQSGPASTSEFDVHFTSAASSDDVVFGEASDSDLVTETAISPIDGTLKEPPSSDRSAPASLALTPERPAWMNRRAGIPTESEAVPDSSTFQPAVSRATTNSTDSVSEQLTELTGTKTDGFPPESADAGNELPSEKRSGKSRKGKVPPAFPIKLVTEEPSPRPWPERIVRWVVGIAGAAYGASILFHLLLLLVLSFVVIVPKLMNGQMSLTASQTEGADSPVDTIADGLDLGGGGEDASTPIEMSNLEVIRETQEDMKQLLQPDRPSEFAPDVAANGTSQGTGKGKGIGDGEGDTKGLPFAMPKGGAKVARKGRFAAWTIPADPEPGQNYRIIIQVELPENIKRLPKRDLLGSFVQGSDSYFDRIPNDTRGFFPGNSQRVQVEVFVPGASALVKDTIKIKSRLLKEEQTLEIVF